MDSDQKWYQVNIAGEPILTPLPPERVGELQAEGWALQPAAPPGDLAERLAQVVRTLTGGQR